MNSTKKEKRRESTRIVETLEIQKDADLGGGRRPGAVIEGGAKEVMEREERFTIKD